jgi:RNA polymerase sigma-70 factor (ECF subfamily)
MQSTGRKLNSSEGKRGGNSDKALVQRVKQGDRSAFDLLVVKYQHKILNLIMRYVKDPSEAMDVAQEAFIKAYRAVPGFRGDSAFYTWLYRIAINTAKNHLVAARRRPMNLDFDLLDSESFEPFAALRDGDSPEHLALTDEIGEVINKAIKDLPDELRTAILLREIEGMSYEEIAETMECPVGTVRSRIFRAREAIDKKIRPLM